MKSRIDETEVHLRTRNKNKPVEETRGERDSVRDIECVELLLSINTTMSEVSNVRFMGPALKYIPENSLLTSLLPDPETDRLK